MKLIQNILCSAALIVGLAWNASLRADSEEVTLEGVGCCAKCKLSQTDSCQNAIKSGDKLYLLDHNAVSKAFHKNLCSGTKNISVTGKLVERDGDTVLVATRISLAGTPAPEVAKADDGGSVITGKGVCTKCACKLTDTCQNGVIVDVDGKSVLHLIEHNDVSKAFHKEVCQATVPVVVHGKVTDVAGVKKITATKIEVAAKEEAKAPEAAPKKVAVSTIKGTGLCMKCELGKSDSCQNAVQTMVDGKEVLYVFAQNECSKGFHSNLCSHTAPIVAVGSLAEENGAWVFTAQSLQLQEEKTLTGEALCLKCGLQKSRTCQNALKVEVDGKELVYVLDQNELSRKFHSQVCQSSKQVTVRGSVAELNDRLELTATDIQVK